MSEIQGPDGIPNAVNENRTDRETNEKDPATWYGLVWRIVRTAIESDANLIRICVLICLVGAALWFIASVVR